MLTRRLANSLSGRDSALRQAFTVAMRVRPLSAVGEDRDSAACMVEDRENPFHPPATVVPASASRVDLDGRQKQFLFHAKLAVWLLIPPIPVGLISIAILRHFDIGGELLVTFGFYAIGSAITGAAFGFGIAFKASLHPDVKRQLRRFWTLLAIDALLVAYLVGWQISVHL